MPRVPSSHTTKLREHQTELAKLQDEKARIIEKIADKRTAIKAHKAAKK